MEAWDGMGWVGMAGWEKALSQYLFRLFSISLFDTANTLKTRRFDWTAKHTYVSRLISFWISQVVQGVAPSPPRHTRISSSISTPRWAGWLVMVGNG